MTSKTQGKGTIHLNMVDSILSDSADSQVLTKALESLGIDATLAIFASKLNRDVASAKSILETGKSPNALSDDVLAVYNDMRASVDRWNSLVNATESLQSAGKTMINLRFSVNGLGELDAPIKTNTARDAVNDNRLASVMHCVKGKIMFKVSRDFTANSKAGKYLAKHGWKVGTDYIVDSSLDRNAFGVLNDDNTWTVYQSGAQYADSVGIKN